MLLLPDEAKKREGSSVSHYVNSTEETSRRVADVWQERPACDCLVVIDSCVLASLR